MLSTPTDFSDLEDLDELRRDGIAKGGTPREPEAPVLGPHSKSQGTIRRFVCGGCHGKGYIEIYRRGGGWDQIPERKKCWKGCNGTGYTKTDPETLRKRRAAAADKKRAKARANSDAANAFLESREDIRAWFKRNTDRGDQFAMDLHDALFKYGSLTERQLAAVERSIARYNEIVAQRKAEREAQPTTGIDLSKMVSGYYAVPNGDTRLKVKIDVVTKGKWKGWVFVKDGAEYGAGARYGSQRPGEEYKGKIVDELRIIAADPLEASKAYGKLVGRCGACGRLLEDEQSIANGIGPVCARKF